MKVPTSGLYPSSAAPEAVTVLGLGSLLSEKSSRTTFPDLKNFRLGRVSNRYRRVFGHPASIFFERGLANVETKEMSSLSAEEFECPKSDSVSTPYRGGFICSVFEVPRKQVYTDEIDSDGRIVTTEPTGAFLEREEEFDIVEVPYMEFTNASTSDMEQKLGILCTRFTDEGFMERWGKERFDEHYTKYGIHTIWGWEFDSGLLPCRVYLRHCYLAAKSMGPECFDSFLDETFLADRTTTIRQYLDNLPYDLIESTIPPPGFEERYSG